MVSPLPTGTFNPPRSSAIRTPGDAICFLGKCFSHHDTAATIHDVKASLADDRSDWLVVAGVANHHAVTPAVWAAINRKGLAELLPADLSAYLQLLYDMNRQRNRLIREQALEAVRGLNRYGIRPVVMKSALTLFEVGSDEGASIMTDVDLLIARRELDMAMSVLRSLGYDLLCDPPAHAHALTFHRSMSLATIDLHCDVGPQRALLSPAAATAASEPINRGDATMSGLAVSHRVLLLVMNFCIFERHYLAGHIPMRGLRDLACLCERRGREIDWEYLFRTINENHIGKQAAAMFHMASQLVYAPVPIYLRRTAAAHRHLSRCLLQLAYPALGHAARSYAQIAWPFNGIRMDYRHHCGMRGGPLAVARIRHAIGVLARRNSLRAWRAMIDRRHA